MHQLKEKVTVGKRKAKIENFFFKIRSLHKKAKEKTDIEFVESQVRIRALSKAPPEIAHQNQLQQIMVPAKFKIVQHHKIH